MAQGERSDRTQEIEQRRERIAEYRLRGEQRPRVIADLLLRERVPIFAAIKTVRADMKWMDNLWKEKALAAGGGVAKGLALTRLERAAAGLQRAVDSGNTGAVLALVRVVEREAAMYGYDAPRATDVTSGGKPITIREIRVHMPDSTPGGENAET